MSARRHEHWLEPSAIPPLEPSEIHIWKIHLAAPAAGLTPEKILSAEEYERAARYHFVADKNRFAVCRAVLRRLLGAHLEIPPADVRFDLLPHGKPVVSTAQNAADLRFSCSHSGDWALIAIARGCELGVDLEQHRERTQAEDVAARFFSETEIRELAVLPQNLKTTGFFNAWTRKEAFVKALGLGLSFPLESFSVALAPGQPAALLAVANDSEAVKKWTLTALDVRPDYSAALAFAGKHSRVRLFNWNFPPPV